MKIIKTQDILVYLKQNKVECQILNKEHMQNEYAVASLFNPVDNGFYYLTGSSLEIQIKNSLILSEKPIGTNANLILHVKNADVQILYYKLLHYFFGQQSSGIIDNLTKVNEKGKIGKNVQIDAFTVIDNCNIGNNVIIGSHCRIHDNVTIEDNTVIESGSIIGTRGMAWVWNEDQTEKITQPQLGGVIIGEGCILGANTIVVRGSLNENTQIGKYCHLAPGCRLGHGTKVGAYSHLANSVITGGNTVIGGYCFIGSNAIFTPKIKIDDHTIVGAGSVVVKNTTKEGLTLVGVPAKELVTKDRLSGMPKPKITIQKNK